MWGDTSVWWNVICYPLLTDFSWYINLPSTCHTNILIGRVHILLPPPCPSYPIPGVSLALVLSETLRPRTFLPISYFHRAFPIYKEPHLVHSTH